MPHLTVAIPVFNRAHLVGQTIESVLKQDFQDYDLLVVDDASTDKTVEVVQSFVNRGSRIRLVINKKNLGLTRNWNRCLELAQGPLVQILLSDDLIDTDYLGKVSQIFEQYPNVGIVAASCRYIDAQDRVIHEGTPVPSHLYRAGDEAVRAFLEGGYPHVSSIVFRRECYKKLGLFNEKIWHGPDVEMDARIAQKYDFYHFGSVHTSFRRHGSNMGALEYLRRDFLEVDYLKFKMAWSCLTVDAIRQMGITDLDSFVSKYVSCSALTGIPITIAYGRADLARFYLKESFKFNKNIWKERRYWKSVLMLLFSGFSRKLIQKRMNIDSISKKIASSVEQSLKKIA